MATSPHLNYLIQKPLLRDLIFQLQHKQAPESIPITNKIIVNPEDIRKHMKKSWKDGGLANKQFGQLKPIRGKMLTEWQIQRMPLSKRSYSTSKNVKAYKFDSQSRPFSIHNQKKSFSAKFLKHLQKVQQQYEAKLFMPKPSEKKTKNELLKRLNTTNMKFTAKSDLFGATNPWKKDKLTSFKSQIFLQKK